MHGSIEARDATDIPVVVDDMTRDGGVASARGAQNAALSFFCPDVTDASTLKRVQQFMDFGYSVTVFGFRRERYNTDYQPPWPNVPLGFTTDARYWHRLSALLHAIPTLFANRRTMARASIFYARNIDQLLLALLGRLIAFSRAPIAYEVLDIPPILMRRGLVPTFLRAIERLCLRRVSLLVLSSPGFHRNYFSAVQKYAGAWFLLENKLYPSPSRSRSVAIKPPGTSHRPWVVGYFGLIRGEATVDLIARLAHRLQDRVIFKFGGVFTTVEQAKFETVLRRCPNVDYSGPYLPQQDLERLYRERRLRLGARPRAHRPQLALADALPLLRSRLLRRALPCRSPLRGRQRHREASHRLDVRCTARGIAGPLLRAADGEGLRTDPRAACSGAVQHVRRRRGRCPALREARLSQTWP